MHRASQRGASQLGASQRGASQLGCAMPRRPAFSTAASPQHRDHVYANFARLSAGALRVPASDPRDVYERVARALLHGNFSWFHQRRATSK